MKANPFLLGLLCSLLGAASVSAQAELANYDEAKVPAYTLPPLLVCEDGTQVNSPQVWEQKRRPEILELFRSQLYGRTPNDRIRMSSEVLAEDVALQGKALRRQVRLTFSKDGDSQSLLMLIYLPREARGPVPVFLSYNFYGNQTIASDTAILKTTSWSRNNESYGIRDHDGSLAIRGVDSSRWALDSIIDAGFGLATACYNDIYPDGPGNRDSSVIRLFGQPQQPDNWCAIGAWAWGMSRMLDYLEQMPEVDASRVIAMGHSRQGKTALWAGAQDPRFAVVISNNSGCGGAALFRRQFGETAELMHRAVPYWMCENFGQYCNNEPALPVDQHQLIALMAPRPVYVASAAEDGWADPKGEFLSVRHADPVYHLYGYQGMETDLWPAVDSPLQNRTGYHVRRGGHDVTTFDWQQYIAFARRWLMP